MRLLFIAVLLALGALGCQKDVGDACEVTGDGFTRYDPCGGMCVERPVTCEDGREVPTGECAGELCGGGEPCPEGQLCVQVDSFPQNARCMRATLCAPDEMG